MKKQATLLIILFLTVLSSPLISNMSPAPVHANPQTRVEAPLIQDQNILPGTRLNITIELRNVGPSPEDLDAWEVRVKLNATHLRITRVIIGPLLSDWAVEHDGSTLPSKTFNATAGTASANELMILGQPQPPNAGFTGGGVLVHVEVTVLRTGTSTIELTDTKLRDVDGTVRIDILHSRTNGVFCNLSNCNQPPTASFTVTPESPIAGNPAVLDGSPSSDPDGSIVDYSWDFGDGSPPGSGVVVSHTYTQVGGPLTVTLTVTDNGGLTDTAGKTNLFVEPPNILPIALFTFSPSEPEAFQDVTFDASASYDPDGNLSNVLPPHRAYAWNFGDAVTTTAFSPQIAHRYTAAGNYTVILTVEDEKGGTNATSRDIMIGEGTLIIQDSGLPWWVLPSGAVAGLAALAGGFFLWKRRGASRREESIEL